LKLLDKSNYDKVIKPLSKVAVNHLFARSVVEKKVNGSIYVDNTETPGTFYIVHPYGMSLLFGNSDNADFNRQLIDYFLNTFKIRNKHEWLQAYPKEWNKKISALLGDNIVKFKDNQGNSENRKIEENTRVNFRFNKEKYLDFRNKNINKNYRIIRTDKELFEDMNGTVVPKSFWNNAEQFTGDGIGFSLIYDNQVASTAFSAFIHDHQLELGIETISSCRGKGFAEYTCSALIDYCIDNSFEPVWSCRFENTGSFVLAGKLGFEPTIYLPYYRLNN
jgi:hypothetical protein